MVERATEPESHTPAFAFDLALPFALPFAFASVAACGFSGRDHPVMPLTGWNERRWMSHGPCFAIAARWAGTPYACTSHTRSGAFGLAKLYADCRTFNVGVETRVKGVKT